jgi:hypothetical protein
LVVGGGTCVVGGGTFVVAGATFVVFGDATVVFGGGGCFPPFGMARFATSLSLLIPLKDMSAV